MIPDTQSPATPRRPGALRAPLAGRPLRAVVSRAVRAPVGSARRGSIPVAPPLLLGLAAALAGIAALAGLVCGPVALSPGDIANLVRSAITGETIEGVTAVHSAVFWNIRLPRVAMALAVGGALGCAGAALQGLFRNPLADPALIGVSSGAAVGALAATLFGAAVLGPALDWLAIPGCAIVGSAVVTAAVFRLAKVGNQVDVPLLLLSGVAFNALTAAVVALLLFFSNEQQTRSFLFWSMGSLNAASPLQALVTLLASVLVVGALIAKGRALDALLLGEAEAFHLGVDVRQTKRAIVCLCAAAVGWTVALCGIIGFVGLVVPHVVRLSCGPSHRWVIPGSALLGAALLALADLAARTAMPPAELPIGIVTALLGAPFFLWLIHQRRFSLERAP